MSKLTLLDLIDNGYIDIEGYGKNIPKLKKLYNFTEILLRNKEWLRQYFGTFGSVELVVDYVTFHNQAPPDIRTASKERDASEDEGCFTVAGVRQRKKIHQISSNSCSWGRRCIWGLKCKYKVSFASI